MIIWYMHVRTIRNLFSLLFKSHEKKLRPKTENRESWDDLRYHTFFVANRFFHRSVMTERRITRLIFLFSVVARDLPLRSLRSCKLAVTRFKSRIFHNSILLTVETKVRFRGELTAADRGLGNNRWAGMNDIGPDTRKKWTVVYLFFIWRSPHIFSSYLFFINTPRISCVTL